MCFTFQETFKNCESQLQTVKDETRQVIFDRTKQNRTSFDIRPNTTDNNPDSV